ncbi:MAG TPA: HAMP domain-containing histidine kinase [Anaerolineae bacterium]|nr:HAMP domain-containing histidine kinase [Anaerolineae bacterium]
MKLIKLPSPLQDKVTQKLRAHPHPSIRLRLTLIYTAILALTLIFFGVGLYHFQSRMISKEMEKRFMAEPPFIDKRFQSRMDLPPDRRLPPGAFIQLRNLRGDVIQRSGNLGQTTLPLSSEGLKAVQQGKIWQEKLSIEGEPFLIFSRPSIIQGQEPGIAQIAISLAEPTRYLNILRSVLLFIGSIVVIAAFGIGWILSGFALRPIHQITQTARAIGSERNFSRRVEHLGPNDEIGQLATTFNKMLAELETSYQQVAQALEAQKRFVSDASHELRTPLTTIKGNLALLRREPPISKADRFDALQDMGSETDRLIRLVNNLLILARADSKTLLQTKSISLYPLLEDVYRQAKNLAPARSVTLTATKTTVIANPDALKQVLLALVDNAIQHTPPDAEISLSAAVDGEYVHISVSDTGPGIDSAVLPHIFERFYQGDSSRSGQGTGLGLAIAKELAEAQSGRLSVKSQSGQGSVFTVTLFSEGNYSPPSSLEGGAGGG